MFFAGEWHGACPIAPSLSAPQRVLRNIRAFHPVRAPGSSTQKPRSGRNRSGERGCRIFPARYHSEASLNERLSAERSFPRCRSGSFSSSLRQHPAVPVACAGLTGQGPDQASGRVTENRSTVPPSEIFRISASEEDFSRQIYTEPSWIPWHISIPFR